MITFRDGPAAGQVLTLSRAPVFLRAVRERGTENWDALDLLTDTPRDSEEIVVYRRESEPVTVHISRRPRSQSGWYQMATYRVVDPQPQDAEVRRHESWRKWCESAV